MTDSIPELRDMWFRVPDELTDQKYTDQVRFIRRTMRKKFEHITNYVVFTTTDCNARCFYCYEMGRSRIAMSEETAHKAADYMIKHCGEKKKISIQWFGGEPLFNKPVIDIICNVLTKNGIEYHSTMISNGYLFDDETVKQAAELWMLKRIQISLDGTEAIYNKSKAYIYNDDISPYRKVIDNIGRLLDAGILVGIRLNMDMYNAADLMLLADELHEHFGGRKNFFVYSHTLFEFSGNETAKIRAEDERCLLYEKQIELRNKLAEYGIGQNYALHRELRINHCMADSGNSVTILPSGEIGLCEHYTEDNFIGHIDRANLDADKQQSFRECWEQNDDCCTCFYYPECIRLKKCLEQKECFTELRDEYRQKLTDGMINAYKAWLNKEEKSDDIGAEDDEDENVSSLSC